MKHMLMRIMVSQMRWMTRYLGFVARPIVRVYGNNEIIACGLRDADGVSIIYSPGSKRKNDRVVLLDGKQWKPAQYCPAKSFSGSCILRVIVPGAQNGAFYKMIGMKESGRGISSPTITVKKETVYDSNLVDIQTSAGIYTTFSWKRAEIYDPMIYFLAIEGETGSAYAAVYTRESFWVYPRTKTASYSVGPVRPPSLISGKKYTVKLVLVDYDGWVSHIALKRFSI